MKQRICDGRQADSFLLPILQGCSFLTRLAARRLVAELESYKGQSCVIAVECYRHNNLVFFGEKSKSGDKHISGGANRDQKCAWGKRQNLANMVMKSGETGH